MARYSFELTDVDERALTAYVADLNVGRVARGEVPYADNQALVLDRVRELVRPVRERFDREDLDAVAAAFKTASLETRAAVKAALGVTDGP